MLRAQPDRVQHFGVGAGGRGGVKAEADEAAVLQRAGFGEGDADGVAVATDGKIYFTDASRRFAPRDWGGTFEASVLDILENSATGRVLVYDPAAAASGGAAVQVVAGGLSFANGIVLTRDGQSLLVNETGRYRVCGASTHRPAV